MGKWERRGKHLLHKDPSIMLSVVQLSGNPLNTGVRWRTKLLLTDCPCFNWFAPALIPHAAADIIGLVLPRGSLASSYKTESKREGERRGSREGQPVASIKNLKTNSLWRNVRLDSSEAGSASCGCN